MPDVRLPSSVGFGLGVGVVALVGAFLVYRYIAEKGAGNAGATVGKGIADAAAGVVEGVGESFGIPRTNESECDKALREGRTWDASFACPAARFIGEGIFGG